MRELTEAERNLARLMNNYDSVMEAPELTITLVMGVKAAAWLAGTPIRILKDEIDESGEKYQVTMLKTEYTKYLDRCCTNLGFKVAIDGTIRTYDDILVVRAQY